MSLGLVHYTGETDHTEFLAVVTHHGSVVTDTNPPHKHRRVVPQGNRANSFTGLEIPDLDTALWRIIRFRMKKLL